MKILEHRVDHNTHVRTGNTSNYNIAVQVLVFNVHNIIKESKQ